MSVPPVFCPSCGTQNVSGLRFCTRCGTNLEAVSHALTGSLVPLQDAAMEADVAFAKAMSRKLYKLLSSIAFFAVMFYIFGGAWWTLFLLFWVADPLKDLVYLGVLKKSISDPVARKAALDARKGSKKKKKKEDADATTSGLAPDTAEPVALASVGQPFELAPVPPSVTEGTTRHLDEREPSPPRYSPPTAR
jgi:hypothetical protein